MARDSYCPGAGDDGLGPRDIGLGRTAGVCPRCGRVGVLRKDGSMRQHQRRGRTTRTHDVTMEHVYAMALHRAAS